MKIVQFEIKNFRGISHTKLAIADEAPGNVCTLIGLNESGKTTILEALSHFGTEDKDTATLVGTVQKKSALQDLIPKAKKAAFTDRISIQATVQLDESDKAALVDHFKKSHDLILDRASIPTKITVDRGYRFEDSRYVELNTFWHPIKFRLKTKKAQNYKEHGAEQSNPASRALWLEGITVLRERLPKIVYFPTFLFDFPDRIYLSGVDTPINAYYMQVVQDVLDSQGDGLDLKKHIIDRIDNAKKEHSVVETFFAFFFQRDEKKQIDAVLQKAATEMSSIIFGSWNQILGKNVTNKRVHIDWLLDGDKDNSPYLEISIVDGQAPYSLSERSLGFRWFFFVSSFYAI